MQKDKYLTNEKIRDPNVLVVDENGTNLGAMNTKAAIRLAQDKGLDLVLFVPSSKTGKLSICKIIDYGKFKYQQDVKQKEAKKNQVVIKTKEVKVRPQIGAGDLQ
ncbi:MAG: translation initiation factor IF-3 [Mycoplasmoidaceae bacterium]|nr:translation initiation factor IF-3 [Mycoplasmoidaceae bacterium]